MQVQGLVSSQVRDNKENNTTSSPMLTLKPDPETLFSDPDREPSSVIIPQPPSWESGLDKDDISDQEENKFAGE